MNALEFICLSIYCCTTLNISSLFPAELQALQTLIDTTIDMVILGVVMRLIINQLQIDSLFTL